jgi:hypothetical protein
MTQTTFGYDQEEDRLWLCYHEEQPRIWITRRFAQGLIGPMAELIERTTTMNQLTGLAPHEQIRMEHRLAVQETPDGDSHYPFRISQEDRDTHRAQGFVLCKTLQLHMEPQGCSINMQTDEGEVNFGLSRYDTHLWLRAFRMALDNANWNLPALPVWLTEPVLPPSIQTLLTSPLPSDLDSDTSPDPAP